MATESLHRKQDDIKNLFVNAGFHLKNGEYNEAIKILNTIVTDFDPHSTKAWLMYAEIKLIGHKPQDVLEALKEIQPQSPPDKDITAKVLYLKAKAFFDLKKWEDCRFVLVEILKGDQDNQEALELLADLRLELNRPLEAIRTYKNLLKQSYDVHNIMYSLALAYDKTNQPEWAFHFLDQLKDLAIQNPQVEILYKKNYFTILKKLVSQDKSLSWADYVAAQFSLDHARGKVKAFVGKFVSGNASVGRLYVDTLTNLYNKDAVMAILPKMFSKTKEQFFLGRVRIDFFKSIVQVYGQDVADEVLKAFGKFLNEYYPEKAFRLADENFLWAYEGNPVDMQIKSKAFREAVEHRLCTDVNKQLTDNPIKSFEDKDILMGWRITCSQGISLWDNDGTPEQIIKDSEANLYQTALEKVGHNAIFYRMTMVEKGLSPVEYNPLLINLLNKWASENNHSSWLAVVDQLDPFIKADALKTARTTEKEIRSNQAV